MTHMKNRCFTRPDGQPEVFTRTSDLDFAEAVFREQARQDEIRDTQGRIIWRPGLWIVAVLVLFWAIAFKLVSWGLS